jgi:hypothetical protein
MEKVWVACQKAAHKIFQQWTWDIARDPTVNLKLNNMLVAKVAEKYGQDIADKFKLVITGEGRPVGHDNFYDTSRMAYYIFSKIQPEYLQLGPADEVSEHELFITDEFLDWLQIMVGRVSLEHRLGESDWGESRSVIDSLLSP